MDERKREGEKEREKEKEQKKEEEEKGGRGRRGRKIENKTDLLTRNMSIMSQRLLHETIQLPQLRHTLHRPLATGLPQGLINLLLQNCLVLRPRRQVKDDICDQMARAPYTYGCYRQLDDGVKVGITPVWLGDEISHPLNAIVGLFVIGSLLVDLALSKDGGDEVTGATIGLPDGA